MDAECFGGEESTQYSTYPRSGTSASNGYQQQQQHGNSGPSSGAGGGVRRERTRNAFMLVYDRAMPDDGQPAGGGEEAEEEEGGDQHLPRRSPMSSSSSASSSASSSSLSRTSPPTPVAGSAALPVSDASLVAVGKGDGLLTGGGGGRAAVIVGAQADRGVEIQRSAAEGGGGGGVARGRERRKRFRAKVPAVFMRQIHQENLEFWRFVACIVYICDKSGSCIFFVPARTQAPSPRVRSGVRSCLHVDIIRAFGGGWVVPDRDGFESETGVLRYTFRYFPPMSTNDIGLTTRGKEAMCSYPELVQCAMIQAAMV